MSDLLQLYFTWFKMGLFTFGGGYAMLPMIQKEIVSKKRWASDDEIMSYYAIGQCIPGVIAVNTATFVGCKQKGTLGGIVSTLGVISPSVCIILIIAASLQSIQELEVVQHALHGISIGVCVLLSVTIYDLAKKNINQIFSLIVCIFAFIFHYVFSMPSVICILIAGICGWLKGRMQHGEHVSFDD